MKRFHHCLLVDPHNVALCHRGRGAHSESLTGERALAEEFALRQNADRRFAASFRYDGELHLTFLDVEHSIGGVALREYRLLFRNSQGLPAATDRREESAGVELPGLLTCRCRTHRYVQILAQETIAPSTNLLTAMSEAFCRHRFKDGTVLS